ncbi:MAG: hypothetical protein V1774_00330, partial [Candidatus Eisenbacteria bacterium]
QRAGGVWTTEARIPYAALSTAPPAPGSAWRVNFRRKDAARGSAADWQVPIGYDPARFGYLFFE